MYVNYRPTIAILCSGCFQPFANGISAFNHLLFTKYRCLEKDVKISSPVSHRFFLAFPQKQEETVFVFDVHVQQYSSKLRWGRCSMSGLFCVTFQTSCAVGIL